MVRREETRRGETRKICRSRAWWECHESKSKCHECKSEAGMPSVDLSNFRATSLQMKGKDLKERVDETDVRGEEEIVSGGVPSPSVDVDRLDTGAYARDRSSSRTREWEWESRARLVKVENDIFLYIAQSTS